MPTKVLTIAVPVLSVEAVPYGPAVVNGILDHNGYDSSVWDLNIDLYQQYLENWNSIVDLFGNRAYQSTRNKKINFRNILKTINVMLKAKIGQDQPDIILLSVFSSQSLDLVIPLSTMIKKIVPNCYMVVGGRGLDNTERITKLTYAELYNRYLPVDCCYLGDAENNLVHVLETRHSGIFLSPPVTSDDLTNIPAASWTGYDFSLYRGYELKNLRLPITGSKGCVRDCTFCDVAGSWPKFVYRNGSDIAKEIVDTYHSTGLNKFEFTDNLVNGSIKNFRAMNSYIADHAPNEIDYLGYAICRPRNEFPKSDFKLAKAAGASLFKVGIESGSDRVRYDMRKKFTTQDISWFAENCHDQGIKQIWLMFVGYPTETEEDFQESIDLLKNHSHLTSNGLIKVFLSLPMMLTSGSAFTRKYGEEYGLSHNQSDPWSDFFWTSSIYKENTFKVRANRWRRFIDAVKTYGFEDTNTRQAEKLLEIDGIEKLYNESYSNGKKIIPISKGAININQETHI